MSLIGLMVTLKMNYKVQAKLVTRTIHSKPILIIYALPCLSDLKLSLLYITIYSLMF